VHTTGSAGGFDCIYAGCNVIIEKPIALSLEDADSIFNAAKERGCKSMRLSSKPV